MATPHSSLRERSDALQNFVLNVPIMSITATTTIRESVRIYQGASELDPRGNSFGREDLLESSYLLSTSWQHDTAANNIDGCDLFGPEADIDVSNDCNDPFSRIPDCLGRDGSPDLQMPLESHLESNQIHKISIDFSRESAFDSAPSLPLFDASDSKLLRDPPPTCRICEATFDNAYLLEDHARIKKHYTYECPEDGCDKKYRRRDVLRRHRATHGHPEFLCKFCPQTKQRRVYQRRDNLSQHIRTRHPADYRTWKSTLSASLHPKSPPVVAKVGDTIGNNALKYSSGLNAGLFTRVSPDYSTPDVPMTNQGHGTTADEVASTLGSFLGDKDHIVVQIIQHQVDLKDESITQKLAAGLAELALKEPQKLPETARVQLEQPVVC